jgi:exodeoxyribonuclease VII large subunit
LSQADVHAVTVSELTGHIKAILEGTFPSIWVAGEISDLVRPRSGHLYFTLKDDQSQIRGVIWRSAAARLRDTLAEGQSVLCFGDVEVYAPRGTYQLVVRKVQTQGLGALQIAFQKLQAKLNAEGLFDASRKRPLPRFPRRIGVVTSPSGAAIRDFLKAAAHRWRGIEMVIIPALVQGTGAARSLVAAIEMAHRYRPALDALVIARGGGSLEDLWSFNEEVVVRAVAASKIPTISAVGHEIDVTLCDLAADVRALTPTDGATKLLPDAELLQRTVTNLRQRLCRQATMMIEARRAKLESVASRTVVRKPHELILDRARVLDEFDARARRAMFARVALDRAKLATAAASLSALSPLNVLTRGYSVTLDSSGKTITRASEIQQGDPIRTRLQQGEIRSVVTDTSET